MSKLSAEEKFFQTFFVYKITNKLNGKIYIGKSNNPNKRWKAHLTISLGGAAKYPKAFYAIHGAIAKYGSENFEFSVIDKAYDAYKVCEYEKFWIKNYQSNIKGYNLTPGGESMVGSDNPFWNKKHSETTKELLSQQRQAEGRSRGEKNPKVKLTEAQAIEIKYSKIATKTLSIKYDVDRTIIQRIRSGKIWKHI